MPSKTRKQSKTPLRPPSSNQSASPRTPSCTPSDVEVCEEDLKCSLEEASGQYPFLIGKSAFIGQIIDVDSESRGCEIWLSESSMVSASFSPGSIVSVSIAALGNRLSKSFPLSSLMDGCARHFGVDSADETAKEMGNFFALAKVFPSCKVLKNGVRLSSNLSYTMGCPPAQSIVFVYPIQSHFLTDIINGSEKPDDTKVNCLSLHSCKELYLELFCVKNKLKGSGHMLATTKVSTGKTYNQFENANLSSPMTPLYQKKLISSGSGLLSSPPCEESVSNLPKPNISCVDSLDIEDLLRDETAKKLLETCSVSWLSSRSLLCGNIVAIPILSELCIFQVRGGDITNQDLTDKNLNALCSPAVGSVNHVNGAFVVDRETKVYLNSSLMNSAYETPQKRGLPSIQLDCDKVKISMEPNISRLGGLSEEYEVLKEIVCSSTMKNALSSFGLRATKGVLLHGPPGTGKTSLAQLCVHDAGVNLFTVNGPEIVSTYYGESEQALHEVFDSANRAAPSVVFIDELDAIAPARKDGGEELSQRMVATLLNLMDGISRSDGVLVIAATNRPDSIEPALRRSGRLDRELEIGVPSPKQRLDILYTILSEMDHYLSDIQVQQLAMITHGFVGADLASLCNEAALVCLRRYVNFEELMNSNGMHIAYEGCSVDKGEGSDLTDTSDDCSDCASSCVKDLPVSYNNFPLLHLREAASESRVGSQKHINTISEGRFLAEENCMLKVAFEDFEKARMKVRPSAMREVILEVPKVNWEDVGGQREVKAQLMEAVEWPQKHQDAFRRIGSQPPMGVLMFGPPGCSKTLLARAVASEAGLNFLAVKGPELFSKWVGESEKAVRSLFAKARANAPSIIFFDEIDSLAIIRGRESDGVSVSDRVMSQLLVELDGLHQRVDVTVIAATNRPDKIDPALLRPGRFDRLLYVGPPNETDREEIFHIHLRKMPCSPDISLKELASLTEGCTGADISLICREAAVAAIEENLDAKEITMQHLKAAIRQVRQSEIQLYHELSAKFQRLVCSKTGEDKFQYQQCSSRSSLFTTCGTFIKSVIQFDWFPSIFLRSKCT